jgi:hypothetical protein
MAQQRKGTGRTERKADAPVELSDSPFLKAALEDYTLALQLGERAEGSARHLGNIPVETNGTGCSRSSAAKS